MAEEGTRSRLGRGLAALIGDVGQESSAERPRGQRRLPTGSLRPNARNPRRMFADAELDELAASLRERGIIQPIVVRPLRGASRRLRDHRRRAALARGAARRPARSSGRRHRGDRRRGSATCDHRERAARRSQSARRGGRLSRADGRIRQQPGRNRQDRRQEPKLCRQYAAASETSGCGEGAIFTAANSPPAMRAC